MQSSTPLSRRPSLVDALTHELRIIVELPGRDRSLILPWGRKDTNATREISADLLEAIQPLADVLHPPAPALKAPDVVCAPESLDLDPYLRILRWFLEDGEILRVLGFPDQPDASDPISSILSGALEKLAAARDKATAKTLVAVTDRRIIMAKTNTFLEQGEIRQEIPIERVRYVRAATRQGQKARSAIDLITRDENIRWHFQVDIENTQVDTLAAVLAESMTIPDVEREELRRRRRCARPECPANRGRAGRCRGVRPAAQPPERRPGGASSRSQPAPRGGAGCPGTSVRSRPSGCRWSSGGRSRWTACRTTLRSSLAQDDGFGVPTAGCCRARS